MQVSAFLVGTEERNSDLATSTGLALQPFADFDQGEVVTEMRTKFGEAETRSAKTGTAGTTVVVLIGHVFQLAGFERGVADSLAEVRVKRVHPETVSPASCGLL